MRSPEGAKQWEAAAVRRSALVGFPCCGVHPAERGKEDRRPPRGSRRRVVRIRDAAQGTLKVLVSFPVLPRLSVTVRVQVRVEDLENVRLNVGRVERVTPPALVHL